MREHLVEHLERRRLLPAQHGNPQILLELQQHVRALRVHVLVVVLGDVDLLEDLFLIVQEVLQLLVLDARYVRRHDREDLRYVLYVLRRDLLELLHGLRHLRLGQVGQHVLRFAHGNRTEHKAAGQIAGAAGYGRGDEGQAERAIVDVAPVPPVRLMAAVQVRAQLVVSVAHATRAEAALVLVDNARRSIFGHIDNFAVDIQKL